MGVPPRAMPTRRAITLPRIAGSVESCMMLLVPLVKSTPAAPITMSAAPNDQYPGASAPNMQPIPKTQAPNNKDISPDFFPTGRQQRP